MKIHAIQTGHVSIKQRHRVGKGAGVLRLANTLLDSNWTEPLPIYAWLIEHPDGLILVDTGETSRTAEADYFPKWHPFYRYGVKMHVTPEDDINNGLARLGYAPSDVRWVVMTHLHTDHAGGLYHFPQAEIIVSAEEYKQSQGFSARVNGYLNQHYPSWFSPTMIDWQTAPCGTFPQHYRLTENVVIVPTAGHAPGHVSVIVDAGDHHVFLAGDTSYTEAYLLDSVVDGVSVDALAKVTLARINAYVATMPTVYLPSHDPESAQRLDSRQIVASHTIGTTPIHA